MFHLDRGPACGIKELPWNSVIIDRKGNICIKIVRIVDSEGHSIDIVVALPSIETT